jgi:hypothetical protein
MPSKAAEQKAYRAIGAFQCAFSVLEHELGETIKTILRLQQPEAGDMVVAALGDFARKASFIRAAIAVAKKPDGSGTSDEWKAKTDKTIRDCLGVNQVSRVLLALSEVKQIKAELGTFTIAVPDLLGWISLDVPLRRRAGTSPEALRAVITPASDWVPRPPD